MEKIIEVKNLSISYGQNEVIKNISFEILKGDFVGIAGPNGAGKSTLIRAILGLLPVSSGDIDLLGIQLSSFKDWHKVGYLPQKSSIGNNLFPATVGEVVGLGLLSKKKLPKKINKSDKEKVNKTLSELNILDLKNSITSELSGGQGQKVLLARALVSDPEVLIFDEPSTALDPDSREEFFNLIKKLNEDKKITIILITHDTGYIGSYANKLMYLDHELKYFGEISGFCHDEEMRLFEKKGKHIIWHQHC